MSTSQDSAPDIPTDASPQPKRIVLPHRTKPDADDMGKAAGKQQASQKLQKGSKKGQRLDLKTLLHGAPDEGLEGQVEDQDNKGAGMTSLRLKSTGPFEDDADLAKFDDTEALPQTTTEKTEYDYDDEEQVDSDPYDDDDISMPSKLPTQSRRSGKGDFWKRPLPCKDLVGAIDGPLAPRKPVTQKAKKLRRQEAMERYRAEDERQQANATAGHGQGRLLGAGPGQFDRQAGGGRADR